MWTLTIWSVVITVLIIALAYAVHRWVGIRRDVLGEARAARADTFWAWLGAKAKARWDVTAAAVIAAAPMIWTAGLDTVVIVANLLATVFPALAGLDLSNLMIPPEIRTIIQIGSVAVPPIRDAIEKLRAR